MSRDGIRVEIGESNARGEVRDIELWLAAEQPQPLYLRGLISGEPDAQGRDFLAFEGLSEEESELLERFLFQQHRRAVAAARRRQG
ncbi:Atypical PilZ domain-containing protein, cyclic di-GMP receptor [Thiohalospira halophila DSM 15071]|uniref:Atypical PilZ domain-containing protein, cyclic di-GMP receptor n=1 Tax=Thiohalospira halophila DSM 15071 TaxID=1123397 RepID=A0A1I1PH87_9GAMM|nr:Atypical PilZ domain-containing protein, cyclic di-GMP receptor [Thiohalospira halophila DSM 15071]